MAADPKPGWRRTLWLLALSLGLGAMASPASAQLGGLGRGALGGGLGQILQRPGDLLSPTLRDLDPQTLLTLRANRLDDLIRAHPQALERDDHGAPVVRGQVLAVAPAEASLDIARKAGFEVLKSADPEAEETGVVVLAAPNGLSVREAVKRLRKLDPAGTYDFNHVYLPVGDAETGRRPVMKDEGSGPPVGPPAVIGLIDTGVDVESPVFAQAHLVQKGFVGGEAKPAAHGTEVASLLVGRSPPFRGAAPGAVLFVADVYGDDPAGGAADALVRALFWLADHKARVVNMSLVGPPNAALGAGVRALTTRGVLIVAAVGNDGPAAPPSYPASYPGVVAVTGVDARGRVLIEAGRAEHLDFAAPGADMAAAAVGGGYAAVRGTSFAAPLVAGRLAELEARSDASSARALEALSAKAQRGRGYGRGLVAMDLRTPPAAVHAKPDGGE